MKQPRISILTVSRNSQVELAAAATRVLPALGAHDEWVIQDGASSDATAQMVEGWGEARVQFESQPDAGIYDALNRAVERSTGDFLLVLGADDRLRIRLDEVRSYLQSAHTVYYGDVWRTISQDRYAGEFDAAKLARTNICQQAIWYPRAAFDGRRFEPKYRLQADWVFNMACFADPALEFCHLPIVVADYSQDGVSSQHMDTVFQQEYRKVLRTYFAFRHRWHPILWSYVSDFYRRLPGVPKSQQTPARNP